MDVVPLLPFVVCWIVSGSPKSGPDVSLARTLTSTAVSSFVDAVSLFATGFAFTASTIHVNVAGDASVLPAAAVARTANVCVASLRPLNVTPLEHAANAPPSSEHENVDGASVDVNVND